MRILLADDQQRVRFALRVLLERQSGFEVSGEAADAVELLVEAMNACPDLVLLDWDLPGYPPADLVTEAKSLPPGPQVIVLGRDFNTKPAARAAGADAFVLKGDPPRQLLAAVRRVQPRRGTGEISDSTE